MYRNFLRPLLFLLPAETAHHFALAMLKILLMLPLMKLLVKNIFSTNDERSRKNVFGLSFANPVGLAAGFDKNARYIDELACLGFGFIEIGTVTPLPQPGNEKPRLFRLPQDNAIINRMGFNNDGVQQVVERLKKRKSDIIIGGNIGKNKITPNEKAADDYIKCFEALFDHVDYFVVNVSSPNTPGLRELQEKKPLLEILSRMQKQNFLRPFRKPILLKIAPDLTNTQLDDILEIVNESNIDGIIATNTTTDRGNLKSSKTAIENCGAGGLSGKPLFERSTAVVNYLTERSKIPVIAAGGIMNADDARAKAAAGAVLMQVYTGFIYEGAGLVKKINKVLLTPAAR